MSEELARKFHETYERLAPSFGYETRKETKDFVPTSANGMLMIAVCSEVLEGLSSENKRLRAAIEEVQDEWQSALYGDLENGVKWLNEAASEKFAKDYPEISSFGGVLERICHKCGEAAKEVNDAEVQD